MKFKERVKKTWKWLRVNALNKQMIVYVLIAEVIFWSPCIISGVLAVTISPWWWTVFSAICVFWAGPITPAVPLQIGLAILIKKIVERKKKMKVNTNLELRERSRVTLSGFRGLNTLSTAVDVSAIHATEMENLISRDGVNHKRYGWKTQLRIRDYDNQNKGFFPKIQGIFEFNIFTTKFIFAYANKKFWWIDLDKGTYININNQSLFLVNGNELSYEGKGEQTVAPLEEGFLRDQQCKCFQNGNKVYFIGCGDYLVFSRWENDRFEIRRVVGNEDVYIPTTTENIGYYEMTNPPKRITAEEKNLLSPFTKNLLIGPEILKKDSNATYYLDNTSFDNLEVTINRHTGGTVKLTKKEKAAYFQFGEMLEEVYIDKTKKKLEAYANDWWGASEAATNKVEEEITIAKFKNGGCICLKCTVTETEYYVISEVSGLYANLPKRFRYQLYYKRNDEEGTVIEWGSYDGGTIDYKVEWEHSVTVTMTLNFNEAIIDTGDYGTDEPILDDEYEANEFKLINRDSYCVENFDGDVSAMVNPKQGKITFKGVEGKENYYAPLVPGKPNITVKMEYVQTSKLSFNSTLACKFGTQGENDRIFYVDDTGNIIRWSDSQDFTYFGEKSWCVCGTSDKVITGMDRLNDSTMLVVKEYSINEPSVYVITGNFKTGKTEANTIDYYALFSPKGYQVGMGAVGEIVNFNGDCIMVAKDGLYAVSLGENMTVDSRYVLHRSRQISNKLEKFDLANAKCISFNGKFFVAVGGKKHECYIADNKYTASFEGDIQNVVNYEWWRWTNIPVNVWGFVGNELWFGTNDGQLCCFTENFYDEIFSRLHTSLAIYEMEENEIVGFTLNKDIKVSIGDIFTPTCDFYGGITTDRFECVDGETRFYLPLNDYLDGEKIYIDNTPYTITKHDLYFSIQYTTESTELTIYRNYKNKPLTVMDDVVLVLKDRDNKFPNWSSVIANGGLNPANDAFTATLSHKEPVVAKWVSGAMDLGTRVYSKTITGFSLTGEKDLANGIKYGIKSRLVKQDFKHYRANNDLDFEKLDLQTISLDTNFASTYSKKLNIRNVNFVQLELEHDTEEDMAINSIQLEFKLCKKNIGVR